MADWGCCGGGGCGCLVGVPLAAPGPHPNPLPSNGRGGMFVADEGVAAVGEVGGDVEVMGVWLFGWQGIPFFPGTPST